MATKPVKFERSEEYVAKLVGNALYRKVYKDAYIKVSEYKIGNKYKAILEKENTYVQFPRHLRQPGMRYIADVVENSQEGKKTFYSAVKGSIRIPGSDNIVA